MIEFFLLLAAVALVIFLVYSVFSYLKTKLHLRRLRRQDPDLYDLLKIRLPKHLSESDITFMFPQAAKIKEEGYDFKILYTKPTYEEEMTTLTEGDMYGSQEMLPGDEQQVGTGRYIVTDPGSLEIVRAEKLL